MKGEFLTKREFESWAAKFEARKSTGAILATLLCLQGTGFKNPLIVYGSFFGNNSAITFTKAFKAGTTPSVVAMCSNSLCYMNYSGLSNTGVTLQTVRSTDQGFSTNATVLWIAVGEAA